MQRWGRHQRNQIDTAAWLAVTRNAEHMSGMRSAGEAGRSGLECRSGEYHQIEFCVGEIAQQLQPVLPKPPDNAGLRGAVLQFGIGVNGVEVWIARKYREIHGDVVAKAMINSALDPEKGTRIFTFDEVFTEAERAR